MSLFECEVIIEEPTSVSGSNVAVSLKEAKKSQSTTKFKKKIKREMDSVNINLSASTIKLRNILKQRKALHKPRNIYKSYICTKTNKKRYLCDGCDKTFTRSTNLILHKRIHSSDRPYVCSACNDSFTQRRHLERHEYLHTNKCLYVCKVCHKSFIRSSHLKSHSLTHTNDRPYVCYVCNKSFTQNSNLKSHVRIHTNERPYVCEVCDKTFTRSSYLNNHKLKHIDDHV